MLPGGPSAAVSVRRTWTWLARRSISARVPVPSPRRVALSAPVAAPSRRASTMPMPRASRRQWPRTWSRRYRGGQALRTRAQQDRFDVVHRHRPRGSQAPSRARRAHHARQTCRGDRRRRRSRARVVGGPALGDQLIVVQPEQLDAARQRRPSGGPVRSAIASFPLTHRSLTNRRYTSGSTTSGGWQPVTSVTSASSPAPSAMPYSSSDACRFSGLLSTLTISMRSPLRRS